MIKAYKYKTFKFPPHMFKRTVNKLNNKLFKSKIEMK